MTKNSMSQGGEEAFLFRFSNLTKVTMIDVLKYSVGIDVSSEDLVSGFGLLSKELLSKINKPRKFNNTQKGFKSLVTWIEKHRKVKQAKLGIVMEATGVYHERIAHFLYEKDYEIYVVLPNKAKRYLQSIGSRSKNDPIDSRGLTQMGIDQQHLERWHPPSPIMIRLRGLTRLRQQIQQQITAVNNRLHAVESGFFDAKSVKKQHKATIRFHKKQVKQLEFDIELALKEHPLLAEKIERIVQSIKGIGPLTLITLIAETNGFKYFHSIQQITKYAGYDVIENQSGKSKGKERISKKGNARIRRILHMPALNMVTFDTGSFPSLYERIYRTSGIKMKAYVAIQRKLLCLLFTLWKKDEIFDPNFKSKLSKA